MYKGQKSVRGGIQDFLCPFTDMYISQGSNGSLSHKGTMANDVRGSSSGIRYPYYSPCDVKCVWTYPKTGEAMWQSINKVRFANGRIDYASFVTCHDDSFDAYPGLIIPQGNQLGNMGTKSEKGDVTGVHCHIEIAQEKYDINNWHRNQYNIWCFDKEYDTDDSYFVDNTNIIKGNGGNWRTTGQVPVNNIPGKEVVDQILHKGSKVKFEGVFKVDILKTPYSTNLFGCCELTGVSLDTYYNEKCKDYHWIRLDDWTEVDSSGSSKGQDQIVIGGASYVLNKNVYEVKDIDVKTNSAKLTLNGHDIWVYSTFLTEVE